MSDYSAVAPPQNFQSSAFAAALQRAKQIAAKINPSGTSNSSQKRPLEDGNEPEAKKIAGGLSDGGGGGAGGGLGGAAAQAAAQAAAVAARIAAANANSGGGPAHGLGGGGGGGGGGPSMGPGMGPPGLGPVLNEDIKVPDKMVGLIIGRGGEQITRLQSESGCKIQMAPDSNGQPERICSLSGPRDAICRAKELIMNIVHQRGRTEGYGPMGDLLGPGSGGGGGGGGGGGPMGPGGPGGPGGHGGGGGGGGGGGPGGPVGPGGVAHVEIMVPGPKVGLIIGKGGETIKQLQEKSGAKMVVIQDGPNQEQEKPLRISGDPQKVEYAKQLVYDLIAEKEMQAYSRRGGRNERNDESGGGRGPPGMGGPGGYNEYGGPGGGGGEGVEVAVPRAAVGVVIGKGGDMIKKIQAETGARVQFQQGRDEGPGDRRCLLTGKSQNVDMARQRIEELIDSVIRRDDGGPNNGGGRPPRGGRNERNDRGYDRGGGGYDRMGGPGGPRNGNNEYGGGNHNQGGSWGDRNEPQMEVTFVVPSNKCGVIIGKGGETIKQINQQSGAHCELDRRATATTAGSDKTFVIRGAPENVENCKRIISDKVQMLLNFVCTSGNGMPQTATYPGMAPQGYNPQNWGAPAAYQQQWQHGPAAQQPDPSAAAAVAGGAPMGVQGAGPVQVNPQTGQPDYSLQWAEYYRSLGMHREAEMIEQQAKNKAAAAAAGIPGMAAPGAAQPGIPQPAAGAGGPAAAAAAPGTQPAAPGAAPGVANGAGAGQPDYSAQWAEYYRSIGKLKEAEAIEQQMKNKVVQPGATGQQTPGAQVMAGAAAPAGAPGAQFQAQPQAQAAYGAYPQATGYYAAPQQAGAPQAAPQAQYNFPSYNYQPGAPEN